MSLLVAPVSPTEGPPILVVCPPAVTPPAAPPDVSVWATQIPMWFWALFVATSILACVGFLGTWQLWREIRAQRIGAQRLAGSATGRALAALGRRVRGDDGAIGHLVRVGNDALDRL